jgi:hypothetical protein
MKQINNLRITHIPHGQPSYYQVKTLSGELLGEFGTYGSAVDFCKTNPARQLNTLQRLTEMYRLLGVIEQAIQDLDKVDVYGDITENFAEFPDKTPLITERLKAMVNHDIQKYKA